MTVNTINPSRQIILLAHGSRDKRWCKIFQDGVKIINQSLNTEASLAYMEMAQPNLETVIKDHYDNGQHCFDVIPLFFAAGRHLIYDVPEQIHTLNNQLEKVDISLKEAVGHNEAFWHFLGSFLADAIQGTHCEKN